MSEKELFLLFHSKKNNNKKMWNMELNKYSLKLIPSNLFKWHQGRSKSSIQKACRQLSSYSHTLALGCSTVECISRNSSKDRVSG